MIYLKCPTCKNILGNKQIPYSDDIRTLCENKTISVKEREEKQKEILDKYADKMCCRMRLITFIDVSSVVK